MMNGGIGLVSNKQHAIGIFIVIAGVVILLGKLGVIGFLGKALWPLLILIPGLLAHYFVFARMVPSIVLVPGGMLTVYGLLFIFCNWFGWDKMKYAWPVLILGVAVGLYEYYLSDPYQSRGVFVAAAALGVVSLLLLFITLWNSMLYFLAFVLILLGLWLVFRRKPRTW